MREVRVGLEFFVSIFIKKKDKKLEGIVTLTLTYQIAGI